MLIEKVLDNGLKLEIHEDSRALDFCIAVVFFVGSRDDVNPGEHHFLEHLPFRGTSIFPNTLAIAEPVERLAGEVNAYTGRTQTVFHCEMDDPQFLPLASRVVRDLAFRALLRPEDLEAERKVVFQECLKDLNDPDRIQDVRVSKILFPGTGLAHLPLGSPETVQAVTLEDIHRIVKSEFTRENSAVIVAGMLHAKTLEIIQKELGSVEVPAGHDRRRGEVFARGRVKKSRWSIKERVFNHARLLICGYGGTLTERERVALGVFSQMLSGGMSSPLMQEIRVKRFLTYTPHFHAGTFIRGVSSFEFECDCGLENLDTAEEVFWQSVRASYLNRQRFEFAVERLKWRLKTSGDDSEGRMSSIALGLDFAMWIDDEEGLAILESLTLDEVTEIGRKVVDRETAFTFIFSK